MIDKYWYEFSKIYARLMRLEHRIKHSAVNALIQVYGNQALSVMMPFFNQKRRRERYSIKEKCKFDSILNNKKIDDNGKIIAIIDMLYLLDILNLTLKTHQFKNEKISEIFYTKIPADIHDLDKHISDLTSLRNCIAHFNFQLYKKRKTQYLETLYTFELYLGNNVQGIEKLPKFQQKPSVPEILKEIMKLRPDLIRNIVDDKRDVANSTCSDDRLFLSLFDDIALYNGYDASELPSPWQILSPVYLVKELKEKHSIVNR